MTVQTAADLDSHAREYSTHTAMLLEVACVTDIQEKSNALQL
jgi:hypothetical protein